VGLISRGFIALGYSRWALYRSGVEWPREFLPSWVLAREFSISGLDGLGFYSCGFMALGSCHLGVRLVLAGLPRQQCTTPLVNHAGLRPVRDVYRLTTGHGGDGP